MSRRKPTFNERNKKAQQVNKKAIIWVGAAMLAIVVIMTVLLIVNNT